MPCYDERNSPSYTNKHEIERLIRRNNNLAQQRNNNLAQMLCGLCSELHRAGTDSRMYPHGYISRVKGLEEWWKEHQEHDRQREAAEKRAKTLKQEQDLELLNNLARKLGKKII